MGDGDVGVILAEKRLDKGLSLRAAAAEIGVSLDTLRRAERGARPQPGKRGLGEAAALRIAEFYGYRPSELWPIGRDAA